MKNITLLLTLLSALIITGCDKGTDNAASGEATDAVVESTGAENADEAAADESTGEAVVEEAAEAGEAENGATDPVSE